MRKLQLRVMLSEDRNCVGELLIQTGDKVMHSFEVVSVAPDAPLPTVPTLGTYQFIKMIMVPADQPDARKAYGKQVAYFIKRGSNSKEDVLVVHGGQKDHEGKLISTEGGLRLDDLDFLELVKAIEKFEQIELVLNQKKLGFFQTLARNKVSTVPRPIVTTYRNHSSSITDNIFFWMWLYDSVTHSNDESHGFTGFGGGTSGGAGAGGSFDTPADQDLPVINDPFKEEQKEVVVTVIEPTVQEVVDVQESASSVESDTTSY